MMISSWLLGLLLAAVFSEYAESSQIRCTVHVETRADVFNGRECDMYMRFKGRTGLATRFQLGAPSHEDVEGNAIDAYYVNDVDSSLFPLRSLALQHVPTWDCTWGPSWFPRSVKMYCGNCGNFTYKCFTLSTWSEGNTMDLLDKC